jgi:cobalt-zinc-cadmium resistance protein CzcA
MIRRLVDFALENRFLVLAAALLLFGWGAISFHQLPVEAYPDVADNYVEIVTQWPGISAEQMEQQVTIPLETVMNGMPHITHLRSFSLFGLSDIKLIFDDEEENFRDRERALERLTQVTLPANLQPQMQTDWSPAGQIYFFTLHSTNPAYDVMELKSIEDWVVEKNLKAVPNIVDVASFGGPTREYQVRVDPDKLISYGLSLAGGAATHQQQRQRRRQLCRGRTATDQHQGSGPGPQRTGHPKHGNHSQERHSAARQGHSRRRSGTEDPAGPVRAGNSA